MKQYTARVQAWQDAVDFNSLAEKTFGVQFHPEITQCLIDGKHGPMHGYWLRWWVNAAYARKITLRRIVKMCDQLEYGHHIADSIEAKQVKEPA